MNTPQPIDASRLKKMLAGAKAVMQKVESKDYTTGHIDARALTEETISGMDYDETKVAAAKQQKFESQEEYETAVHNSRLPANIKEAMINKPIPQVTLANGSSFSLDDVAELVDKPMGLPKTPKTTPKTIPSPRQITESHRSISNNSNISISKEDLADMVSELVNEKLLEFFVKNHNQRLTEDTIKRTINTLIKEGKLKKAI